MKSSSLFFGARGSTVAESLVWQDGPSPLPGKKSSKSSHKKSLIFDFSKENSMSRSRSSSRVISEMHDKYRDPSNSRSRSPRNKSPGLLERLAALAALPRIKKSVGGELDWKTVRNRQKVRFASPEEQTQLQSSQMASKRKGSKTPELHSRPQFPQTELCSSQLSSTPKFSEKKKALPSNALHQNNTETIEHFSYDPRRAKFSHKKPPAHKDIMIQIRTEFKFFDLN